MYRAQLAEAEARLGPRPAREDQWSSPHAHEWFVLDWNARRLAVLDRDLDAIIRTHARDRKVAAWLEDTARGPRRDRRDRPGHRLGQAGGRLRPRPPVAQGRRLLVRAARRAPPRRAGPRPLAVFRRWPSSSTATHLYRDAGASWPAYREEVNAALAASPRDAVLFALLTLKDVPLAWQLAHSLDLESDDVWERLAGRYETVDPTAVLPILARLVDHDLARADAQHYRLGARRLSKMRRLADRTPAAADVDQLIADLRATHRRRPRLQQEFDRAGLP